MIKIYLIRHTSVDVPPGTCYGQTDVPLKQTFPVEARLCQERIKGMQFDKVFTSPLSRCTRLAEFCGYPEAERRYELLEINFGRWEMQRYDAIQDPTLQTWYDDYLHTRVPEGESFTDQYQRVSSFLEQLKQTPWKQILIFTHGGVLACAQIYSGQIKLEEAFSHIPAYGEMISIDL